MIEPASLSDLETAILTGESITEGDVKRWIGHVAGYNYYGCTECPYIAWSRTDDGNWRNAKVWPLEQPTGLQMRQILANSFQ